MRWGACLVADLIAQNANLAGWRTASEEAQRRLLERSGYEDVAEPFAIDRAKADAAWLKRRIETSAPYREICGVLDVAIKDASSRRTMDRSTVAIRAAMARLEAAAMSALGRPDLLTIS